MLFLAAAVFVACGPAASPNVAGSPRQQLAAGLPPASVIQPPIVAALGQVAATLPSPTPSAPPPSSTTVAFSHLPPGTYQVHLHAICNGGQGYHLAYLPNLAVGAGHIGQIQVPAADLGRGWCVIVYSDAVHSIVLTTQRI
jgi:hypothetical protein